MSLKSKLKSMKKVWKDTREDVGESSGGFESVPPGNYRVSIEGLELTESKTSGSLIIKRKMKVIDGEYNGSYIFDNMSLETERGPEFLMKFLNFCGVECDDIESDLEDALETIQDSGAEFKVRVKVKDDFTNVYFTEILEEGNLSSQDGEDETEEEGEDEEENQGEEETDIDLDSMSRLELKAFIKENNLLVKVMKKDSDDDIRDKINEQLSDIENEEEEQEEEEEKTPEPPKKPVAKKASKKAAAPKELKALKDFCTAWGIEYNHDDELQDFKTSLKEYDFERSQLTKPEIELLSSVGLKSTIKGK